MFEQQATEETEKHIEYKTCLITLLEFSKDARFKIDIHVTVPLRLSAFA
jgi:hypothetical protein